MSAPLGPDATLATARAWLTAKLKNGGGKCPCCTQLAKVYRRTINAGMARSLIRMYREWGLEEGYLPDLPADSREEGKLAHWGLVQEADETRPDGGRAGWWRVTKKGEDFIKHGLMVPKHILIYDSRCLGYDDPKELIDIRTALTEKFNLEELMSS